MSESEQTAQPQLMGFDALATSEKGTTSFSLSLQCTRLLLPVSAMQGFALYIVDGCVDGHDLMPILVVLCELLKTSSSSLSLSLSLPLI